MRCPLWIVHPVSTHSRPKAAARDDLTVRAKFDVSTHSRPKAAACAASNFLLLVAGFNTQPPEGGCLKFKSSKKCRLRFNTQPPEGGCPKKLVV